MRNIDHYWSNAKPQDESKASLWPFPTDDMRTANWDMSISEIDTIGRAFGSAGWYVAIQGSDYCVTSYKAWTEKHNNKPGDVVAVLDQEIMVAASDGFVCIKAFKARAS